MLYQQDAEENTRIILIAKNKSQYISYNSQYNHIRANMLTFLPKNPQDIMTELKDKFKSKRLNMSYTQKELSSRSGVSLGSLKRFESSGQIALESLLKLAFVLECLEGFDGVCRETTNMITSIDEII
jgi:DNA-binding XRE family transcriptional regulator